MSDQALVVALPSPSTPTSSPLITSALRRITTVNEKNEPVLITQPVFTANEMRSLYSMVAAQPYEIDPLNPSDLRFDGMTVAEVLVRKQIESAARSGDESAIDRVMDRLIGKALSKSENVNLNLSSNYEEFLKRKAKEVLDAEVVDAKSQPFGDLE